MGEMDGAFQDGSFDVMPSEHALVIDLIEPFYKF
jgi:hypothetical protein